MQAHAGGERAEVTQMLDVWRLQAVARGIDRETPPEVSSVILHRLTQKRPTIAPEEDLSESAPVLFHAETATLSERTSEVQRSRDGPNS